RDAQMAVAQIPSSGQSIVSMLDITERKRQEQQLTRLMESFVGLGIDPEENIKRLVAVCGELGQATCALYNRRQDQYLCALGWHTPPDLPSRDLAEGHICADIIRQNTGIPVVIRDLQVGGYAQTDPNVLRYGLKTYIGVVVRCQKQAVGSLCLVYQTDVPPDAGILKVVQILAAAVGNEEERKQAQEQFKLLTSALTAVANAIVITDRHAKIEWVNPAFTRVTGYEADEVIGKDPRLLKSGQHSRAFYADLWDTVLAGNVWRGEVVNKRKDGSLFTEDTTITPVRGADGQIAHFVAIRQDVTERRQLETRMQQAQKMEAIGALAGGIAHDFNNILGAMIGFGSLLQEDTAGNTAAQESVTEILKAADRARELVRQILTFSRQRERKRDVIRLDAVIKEAAKFLRASLPSSIQIQLHLAPDAPTVMADSTQIYQVTMNLATNALHAMEGQSGLLTIGLEAFQADEHFIKMHPGLKPIQYARLTVADTGHGMDAKTLERIFEPFFTTKPVGKGTGLGLSVVHGIVQSHEGAITVYSEVGRGTTFHLYFPAQAQAENLSENAGNPAVKGRGQKILLLDDEPALTTALERQLVRLNYRVTSSNRAREVIDLFRENPARFDLVISDLTMPEMNGLEVARELHVLRPDLPIILVSGFVADLKLETLKEAGVSEVIDKPISVTTLADLLRQTFAPPGAATS
ncbi:MAG TPA: ATP-binding protein, partial [Candidatus Acidoferrales bacterium]|nr:ATP-binding protein [Candidatus Acidoferrales bacterium]